MTIRVIVEPGAQDEAIDAADWYDSRLLGLGDDFLEQLKQTYDKISAFP